MAETSAASTPADPRPQYWDKRVSAAYLRILGHTQQEAAEAVGRAERTIREWEAHPSWAEARAEAKARWLADAEDAARRTVLKGLQKADGDQQTARWLLERTDATLAPPKTKHEHSGPDGAAIPHSVTVRFIRPGA